jgi:hypothetical protein
MTETFAAIIAMVVSLFAAFGTGIVMMAAFIAWRDWQRERASMNREADRSHRLDRVHPKPRF